MRALLQRGGLVHGGAVKRRTEFHTNLIENTSALIFYRIIRMYKRVGHAVLINSFQPLEGSDCSEVNYRLIFHSFEVSIDLSFRCTVSYVHFCSVPQHLFLTCLSYLYYNYNSLKKTAKYFC